MSSINTLSLSTTIFLLIVQYASSAALSSNLSTTEFLTQLFNASEAESNSIVRNFKFDKIASVSKDDVEFLLYSKHDSEPIKLTADNLKLIDLKKPTKIVVHGWLGSGYIDWISKIAKNYHNKGHFNIIAVDWSEKAAQSYYESAKFVPLVGKRIGELIIKLTKQRQEYLKQIHVIGHSFGAQASGFAGQYVRDYSRRHRKIDRITGLDPANVLFEFPVSNDKDLKLSADDAEFVDIIHTNSGFVGVKNPIGIVDFYPNGGGPYQPECEDEDYMAKIVCSHEIAHDYFADAILKPEKFKGVKCLNEFFYNLGLCDYKEKILMGEQVDRKATGNIFLET